MLGGLCIVLIAIASHVAGSSIVGIAASPIIFNTTDSFFVTINSTTGASIPLATVANGTVSNFNTLFTTSENYSIGSLYVGDVRLIIQIFFDFPDGSIFVFTFDIPTGRVISKTPFTDVYPAALAPSTVNTSVMSLLDYENGTIQLGWFDPTRGMKTTPSLTISGYMYQPFTNAFDSTGNFYFIASDPATSNSSLFVVDPQSWSFASYNLSLPVGYTLSGVVVLSNLLYAVRSSPVISPNPSIDIVQIRLTAGSAVVQPLDILQSGYFVGGYTTDGVATLYLEVASDYTAPAKLLAIQPAARKIASSISLQGNIPGALAYSN